MSAAIAQSGSVAQTIAALARWSGWMWSSSFEAASEPITAPTPKLVKSQPATCTLPS